MVSFAVCCVMSVDCCVLRVACSVFGVWCSGVWCLVLSVWCLVIFVRWCCGDRCLLFWWLVLGGWCVGVLALGGWRLVFDIFFKKSLVFFWLRRWWLTCVVRCSSLVVC